MDSKDYLLSIEARGIKLGLQRTMDIMSACGNPQYMLNTVQIAGTNGKGSVSAMMANILLNASYKTGLFTSPHLVNVNERIRINNLPIPDSEIDLFISKFKTDIEKTEATFFETTTAMAFWYFKKEKVDIAILETGLGGRLDSVSVCNPQVVVITPVSLDHMEILGESLAEIAEEKAGVMKKGVPCISAQQPVEVKKVLLTEAKKRSAPFFYLGKKNGFPYKLNIPGELQKSNALLAINSLKHLRGFNIRESAIEVGLKTVNWYGRNQVIQKKPLVVFDVGHNEEGIKGFLNYFHSLNIRGKTTLILALQVNKRIQNLVSQLESVFDKIICTEASAKRQMTAGKIKSHFKRDFPVETIKSPESAIKTALLQLNSLDGMAIIGTHYLGPAVNQVFNISFERL